MAFQVGQPINIPCTFQPGPFSGERLVNIETVDGLVSGFVRSDDFIEKDNEHGSVKAVVQAVWDDRIEVRIRGSFFTTNGIATITSHLAMAA